MLEMLKTRGLTLGGEDPLEKSKAVHVSILAWRIAWIEEPGRLQSVVSHGVGHNWSNFAQMLFAQMAEKFSLI